jgi:hypothetical protein
VDVFRINASHGTRRQQAGLCRLIRDVAKEQRVHPAILLDLQGPKIRLGRFKRGSPSLCSASMFTVTVRPVLGTAELASTSFGDFADIVVPGSRVLLFVRQRLPAKGEGFVKCFLGCARGKRQGQSLLRDFRNPTASRGFSRAVFRRIFVIGPVLPGGDLWRP